MNLLAYEATIHLKDYKFVSRKPYRCSYFDQLEIENQVTKLWENDCIDESISLFAVPVTLTYKREDDKKNRFRCDYRGLKNVINSIPLCYIWFFFYLKFCVEDFCTFFSHHEIVYKWLDSRDYYCSFVFQIIDRFHTVYEVHVRSSFIVTICKYDVSGV